MIKLLKHGEKKPVGSEKVDSSGVSEVMEALQNANETEVRRLSAEGADLHRLSNRGADTLFYAALGNSTSLLAFLLEQGVKPVSRKIEERTTFSILCRHGNLEAVRMLVDRGAQMTTREREGSLILEAIWGRNPALIEYLLQNGLSSEFSETDYLGEALILVAHWNALPLARVLLDGKANVNVQSNSGDNPLLASRKRGHAEMEKLLLQYGADPRRLPGPCHLCGKEFFHGFYVIGQSDFGETDWRCSWCGQPTCSECSPGIGGRASDYEYKICRTCWEAQGLRKDRLESAFKTIWRWAHRKENIGRPRMTMRCPGCKVSFDLAEAVNTLQTCTFHGHLCAKCLDGNDRCLVCDRERAGKSRS